MKLRIALTSGISLLLACIAQAAPVTSCTANSLTTGFTCDIFETDANGTPAEMSDIFQLPNAVTAGYIILLETPTALNTDLTQWSDVLHLFDNGQGSATTGQLLSNTCNCFPTFAEVNAVPNAFLTEVQTGTGNDFTDFTTYTAGANVYRIYSAAPVNEGNTPEPASMGLFASGFVALTALARKRNKRFASKR